jgi:hypothetical protein
MAKYEIAWILLGKNGGGCDQVRVLEGKMLEETAYEKHGIVYDSNISEHSL